MHFYEDVFPFKEGNGNGIRLRAEAINREFDLLDDDEMQDVIDDGDGADLVGAEERDDHAAHGGGVDGGVDGAN
jgi:hypothetical protein